LSTEERVARLENAFATLLEMAQNQSGRLDDHLGWINQLGSRMEELAAAQANSEQKIAALVDAQIHTEEALRRLADEQARTSAQLAETNARIDRLAETVEKIVGGQAGG
jgi:chromosome segregation ATPase